MTRPNGKKSNWPPRSVVGLAIIALTSACGATHHDLTPTAMIASPTGCADISISIYFERGSTHLNHEAGLLLEEASRRAHNCRVVGISVSGLADKPGSPQVNEALSKARTLAVTNALTHLGFTEFQFDPANTDTGATATNATASPLRRRADVQFHLRPQS